MAVLEFPVVGFFVILIAALLLFGEMLVKVRGIFAVIGIGLMAVYFVHFLTADNFLWLFIVYAGGLFFILLDLKVINQGFAALVGIVMVMIALMIPAPSFIYGAMVAMAFLIGLCLSFLFLRVFSPREFWSKLTLRDRLTSDRGYNSINEEYNDLVGKQGTTGTPFRPIGTVYIDDKPYSAITEGKWLEANMPVIVTSVDGTRIVVKEKQDTD